MSTIKQDFEKYIKKYGYENINQVAKACNINPSNLHTNLKSVWGVSMKRAFVIADTLGAPIDEVLQIFYKDQYKENQKVVKRREAKEARQAKKNA